MKKWIALALIFALSAALAACAKEKETPEAAAEPQNTPAGTAGIANPWRTTDGEELYELLQWALGSPEGAEEEAYRWNQTIGLGEYSFTLDGIEWNARVAKADAFTDIAGMYYTWDSARDSAEALTDYDGSVVPGEQHFTVEGSKNIAVGLWYYEKAGLMFTLSADAEHEIPSFPAQEIFFPEDLLG